MKTLALLTMAGGWPDKGPFTRVVKEGHGVGKERRALSFYQTGTGCPQVGSRCPTLMQSRQRTLSSREAGHELLRDPMPSQWEMGWAEAPFAGPPQGTHTLPLPRPRRASHLLTAWDLVKVARQAQPPPQTRDSVLKI